MTLKLHSTSELVSRLMQLNGIGSENCVIFTHIMRSLGSAAHKRTIKSRNLLHFFDSQWPFKIHSDNGSNKRNTLKKVGKYNRIYVNSVNSLSPLFFIPRCLTWFFVWIPIQILLIHFFMILTRVQSIIFNSKSRRMVAGRITRLKIFTSSLSRRVHLSLWIGIFFSSVVVWTKNWLLAILSDSFTLLSFYGFVRWKKKLSRGAQNPSQFNGISLADSESSRE